MTSFFWSSGHIGWPFFGIVVFSAVCLLSTDVVWRVMPTSSRQLLSTVAVVWAVGVAAMVAFWYV